jgi:hypothetical protein
MAEAYDNRHNQIDGKRLERLIREDDLDSQVEWYVYGRCPHPRDADVHLVDVNTQTLQEFPRVYCGICNEPLDTYHWRPSPDHYSTAISDAWPLAVAYRLTVHPDGSAWEAVDCNWGQSGEINAVGTTNGRPWHRAPAGPAAICIAALARAKERRRYGLPPIPERVEYGA